MTKRTKVLLPLLLASSILASSASAKDIDYVIEVSSSAFNDNKIDYKGFNDPVFLAETAEAKKASDSVSRQLLGSLFKDPHPVSVSVLLNSKTIGTTRLEMGFETVFADNIDYEVNFIGRAVFPEVFTPKLSLFFGGKFGTGKGSVNPESIDLTSSAIGGGIATTTIPMPNSVKYSTTGAQVGAIYKIKGGLEVIAIAEISDKAGSLNEAYDRGQVMMAAAATGVAPDGLFNVLDSFSEKSITQYNANIGLRYRF